MIDLSKLNPPQREAVRYINGPLLVLAGAGSGKTRVLTYRIAYLIEQGVNPWNILAITFTNKAAREMADRVDTLVGGSIASDVWISTFHSCCARILRRDIEKLGYKRQFAIYDDDDKMSVIKSCAKELGLDEKQFPFRSLRAVISDAKNKLLSPEDWFKESPQDVRSRKTYELYKEYERVLKSNNALDFDDLLIKTLELLSTNPPVRDYYQKKFQFILVDEYQDTNIAQYEFVRMLAGDKHNLCVVGDDDQSIYGWRGADIRNILEFERDFPETKTVKLEQNYRSTGTILDAANMVIAHNKGRKEKALWTESDYGEKIHVYEAMDERDEAVYIANTTSALMRDGVSPGEIAVLYRTNAQSRVIEEAFVRAGVVYRVYGGLKFYDRKEVKDLIAYMRAIANPDDDVSMRRIINEPRRGIGDSTIDTLARYASESGMPLFSAALDFENSEVSSRAHKALAGFRDLMLALTEAFYSMTPSEFLEAVIDKTGYVHLLESDPNDENTARIENIRELQGAVTEYESQHPDCTVTDFLENVALVSDIDNMGLTRGAVTLMTLHSAKGLEFDCVFIAGMEETIFPISRAVFEDDQLEEERRLAYVGITRAKKMLYLTHARSRLLYNQRQANMTSRFLGEIPSRLITKARRSAPTPRLAPSSPNMRLDLSRIPGLKKGFSSTAAGAFSAGDRVSHALFGPGTVMEILGVGASERMRILFDSGATKVFATDKTPVKKIRG